MPEHDDDGRRASARAAELQRAGGDPLSTPERLGEQIAAARGRTPGLAPLAAPTVPGEVLHDVVVAGQRGGALRAQARVEDLRIVAGGGALGIAGLDGRLRGDEHGFAFAFDSQASLTLDFAVRRARSAATKSPAPEAGARRTTGLSGEGGSGTKPGALTTSMTVAQTPQTACR